MTLEERVAFAMKHADCCDECTDRARDAADMACDGTDCFVDGDMFDELPPNCVCSRVFTEVGSRIAYVNGCPVHGGMFPPAGSDLDRIADPVGERDSLRALADAEWEQTE